ncbi:hypothetical protein HDU98_004078 [Podochytrium sp. JEL0797]|nr:hypothetical protein HDU98_004078 [Podochytrium sp. JEL0797]
MQWIGDGETWLQIIDPVPYQTSFVHKSYICEQKCAESSSNEALEFLGDAFIGAIVGKYLMDRFEGEQEGFLTKTRTRLVRSSMLYCFARHLGLGEHLVLSQQVERLTELGPTKGRNNPRFYEDCFEAFVGAIIQDFGDERGYRYAKRFLISVIENVVDFADILLCNENHKDTLQRFFQARPDPRNVSKRWPNPVYIDLAEYGPFHSKTFVKGVFLPTVLLETFSETVQGQVDAYHRDQLATNPKAAESIRTHAQTTHSKLIGLAGAFKKSVAEQECSRMALYCLSVDEFF